MQYRRLFSHHSKNFHWQINVLITIVAVWGAGIILTAFFLCVPMEKNWHPQVEGTCIPIIPFYYGLQIPNIITDLLIIVVPIREVMLLQLNKRLKTGAITMFALGIITLVFDIVRLVALLELTAPAKMMDFTCKSRICKAISHAARSPSISLTAHSNRQRHRRRSLDHHRTHSSNRCSLHPQRPHLIPPQPQLVPLHRRQHHSRQRLFYPRAQILGARGRRRSLANVKSFTLDRCAIEQGEYWRRTQELAACVYAAGIGEAIPAV